MSYSERNSKSKMFNLNVVVLLVLVLFSSFSVAETITYYHTDLLGSPVAATNQSGQVIWQEEYQPYGKSTINSPAAVADTTISYTGKTLDRDLGIINYGARLYDPSIGRFLSIDQVSSLDGGAQKLFNRYSYAANAPYTYKDPDGNIIETFWDIGNAAWGWAEFGRDVYLGNWGGAAVSGGAALLDTASIFLPGVPGGASFGVKTARYGDEIASSGLSVFSKASEYGIQSYKDLDKLTKGSRKAQGIEIHHLIEQRFAGLLGQTPGDMASIVLTIEEHRGFTNAWRQAIPYGAGTSSATTSQVTNAAKQIYKDYPVILKSLGL